MPEITSGQRTALANRILVRRDFVWVIARDPETGEPDPIGFWNDLGVVTVGDKDYIGAGTVGNAYLSSASDMTIAALTLQLSGLSGGVNDLVRGREISQAPITYSIGLFDPTTRELIDGLIPVFKGRIDDVEIKTPAPGGKSDIIITCESLTRALTIKRTDVRSSYSQKQRASDDDFFKYVDVARDTVVYFGRPNPRKAAGGKH